MIIAIPIDQASLDANVADNFGRAPYYLYYNTDSQQGDFLINFAAQERGGAGIKAAQILVDHLVDIVLTPQCGQNAYDVMKAADIKLYKSLEGKAMDNIDKFLEGQLDILEDIHKGHHGGN